MKELLLVPRQKSDRSTGLLPTPAGTNPLEPAAEMGCLGSHSSRLGCKMLQVFMLQILFAEYLAMVRSEWSTKMLTVAGVDDVP